MGVGRRAKRLAHAAVSSITVRLTPGNRPASITVLEIRSADSGPGLLIVPRPCTKLSQKAIVDGPLSRLPLSQAESVATEWRSIAGAASNVRLTGRSGRYSVRLVSENIDTRLLLWYNNYARGQMDPSIGSVPNRVSCGRAGAAQGFQGDIQMSINKRSAHGAAAVCVVCMVGVLASSATATVIDTSASVTTSVQELTAGVPGSVINDSATSVADLSNLPLLASGSLTSTDLNGVLDSRGQAFGEFLDPTRLDQPNPEEFGLEVASYSNSGSVVYSVGSQVEELRTVIFTTAGSPITAPEIDFGPFGTQTVESRVFFNGAVIFWATQPNVDLTDMLAEVQVVVTRNDIGATLFSTTLSVAGQTAGAVNASAEGPLQFEIVQLSELATLGIDGQSMALLQSLERDGSLVVVVIPEQEHRYSYTVTANAPLVLNARFSARVLNKPGGTGAAVVLGRPFDNLAGFIGDALPGVNGDDVERSVNAATAARTIGLVQSAATPAGGSACGSFGFDLAALLGMVLLLGIARPNRG